MGRGQYDRAAAKAKREQAGQPITDALDADHKFGSFTLPPVGTRIHVRHPADYVPPSADQQMKDAEAMQSHWQRPAFPYENKPVGIVNGFGQSVSQADYDALATKYDRLLRLCQTHGLMIDG